MKAMGRLAGRVNALAPLILLVAVLAGCAAGAGLWFAGGHGAANLAWAVVGALGAAAAGAELVATALQHRLGLDVIAVLALVGALAVGEDLAAAVIAVMVATGSFLDDWANGRAERDLRALLGRAPRVATRRRGDAIETVPVDDIIPGDVVLVATGGLLPVDGEVLVRSAVLDESSLTGEAIPIERHPGDPVRSGVVNVGDQLEMRASAPAAESTHAHIARLVAAAHAARAPMSRLADRYALAFVAASLVAAGATWAAAGATRAVAVLVVATPCPLILAAPIAFVAGLSRAARRGVIVKGAAALERLAGCRTLVLDKTGTVTSGRPSLIEILSEPPVGESELLAAAGALEQASTHPLAHAVVRAAEERGLDLVTPRAVEEVAGRGISGLVGEHHVQVGRASHVGLAADAPLVRWARRQARLEGMLAVFVALDGRPAGVLLLRDELRPDARRMLRGARHGGIDRIVLLTGDRGDVADAIGAVVGAEAVLADQSPADKLEAVERERKMAPTVMIGDGINDAPALAAADVGVAMGARGAAASAEAADVVLAVDRIDLIGEAMWLARRTRRIALESIVAGIGLSLAAMVVAGFGLLPAVWGALLQEAIDVAVILNALRALRQRPPVARLGGDGRTLALHFADEHVQIREDLTLLREAADRIDTAPLEEALTLVRTVYARLRDDVVPHEQAEQEALYPLLDAAIGGRHPTAPMSRAHVEIADRVRRLGHLLEDIAADGAEETDLADLRRLLYGLHAVLELHTNQEEESYLSLAEV